MSLYCYFATKIARIFWLKTRTSNISMTSNQKIRFRIPRRRRKARIRRTEWSPVSFGQFLNIFWARQKFVLIWSLTDVPKSWSNSYPENRWFSFNIMINDLQRKARTFGRKRPMRPLPTTKNCPRLLNQSTYKVISTIISSPKSHVHSFIANNLNNISLEMFCHHHSFPTSCTALGYFQVTNKPLFSIVLIIMKKLKIQ